VGNRTIKIISIINIKIMSINSLRLNAARRRAFRSQPISKPIGISIASDKSQQMVGYNPTSDDYTISDEFGNRKGAKYIPGNNPASGGFDLRDEGLLGQGFFVN